MSNREAERLSKEISALGRVSDQLSSSLSLGELLQTAFFEAMDNTGADGGHISLYLDSRDAFVPRHQSGDALPPELTADLQEQVRASHSSLVRHDLQSSSQIRSVVISPILFEGVVAGLIALYSRNRNHFDQLSVDFVSALASQASVGIVNAQLSQDTIQRERFYAALGRVTLAISTTVSLPTVLRLVCKESLELFGVDGAYVWQIEQDQLVAIAAEGFASEHVINMRLPLNQGDVFASIVAARGEGIFCNRFRRDARYDKRFAWQESIEALIAVPLVRNETIMGVLELVDIGRPTRFARQDIQQVTFFGTQAAAAIGNAQMVTELRQLNEELDSRVIERTQALGEERDRVQYLLRVTSELAASLDQDRVLIRALELVNEVVKASHGSILLVDLITGDLIYPSAFETHQLPPLPRVDLGFKPEQGLAGWIVRHRRAVVIDDTREDERWTGQGHQPELRSALAVPLIAGDEVIGVLALFHELPNAFSQEQLELVEAAALQVANAISNAQLYLLIRDQAERLGTMLREEYIESAKNQAILESIVDGVLVADARGNIILANLAAGQVLGLQREQLLGKSVSELLGLYSATGDGWLRTINRWSRHSGLQETQPFLAERLNIEDKYVSLQLSPVFARGQFFGTVSIFRDITQEVEVDRMKSEFVSTVSHELRTPMTSVKGYAELMLMGAAGGLSESQTRYLEVIRDNADRMSDLVNDLLDISRIESGKTALDLRPLDLVQLVDEVVSNHLANLIDGENKAMYFDVDIATSLPRVDGDQDRITQILNNLLDNAFHYTPENGFITVMLRPAGDRVRIDVSDTGIGISQENIDKIFDRFYRSEQDVVQQVPGTGLGLAIVQSLVAMHGGEIDVTSAPGVGSTFTVYLPITARARVPAG
ncbi:MAG: GAF domain-containing protein [Chloroflexota bacterium]|nr:MAG: GAF domain-containing protein [Chloroflexota bacterium]